jgi:signal transduction histidine kinase
MNEVGACLRARSSAIAVRYEHEVLAALPALRALPPTALIDHLPEFIAGLAAWCEGDEPAAQAGFRALAEGHAITRLGHGVELGDLCAEYALLRQILLETLLELQASDEVRAATMRLNAGLDLATREALKRYSAERDVVRDSFVGILGHDLRGPLNAVMLAASTIGLEPCNRTSHRRLADTIVSSTSRMARMTTSLMDFALAHLGGGIPVVPDHTDLGDICEAAVAEVRTAHPDRDLRLTRTGDLRGYWDRDRVHQALANLIGNAIQHGEDPIEVIAEGRDDSCTTVVASHGPPIEPALIPHLFDAFRGGRKRGNLGLGLYIVRQIALAHGARSSVHSDERATTFTIVWPRVRR